MTQRICHHAATAKNQLLLDLARTTEWIPGLVTAKVEGMKRVCTTGDGFEIHEEISEYSSENRSWRYAQTQVPLPVKNSHGKFSVVAEVAGSLVAWDAEVEVLDPAQEAEVTHIIDGYYKQTLESLRQRIESIQ